MKRTTRLRFAECVVGREILRNHERNNNSPETAQLLRLLVIKKVLRLVTIRAIAASAPMTRCFVLAQTSELALQRWGHARNHSVLGRRTRFQHVQHRSVTEARIGPRPELANIGRTGEETTSQ